MKTGRARVLCSSVSAFLLIFFLTGCGGGGGSRSAPLAPPPPPTPSTTVHATVDVLTNRHAISPFIYGVNFPPNGATYIQDSGSTLVRWGGNASTRYNYLNFNTNAANDFYFVNRTWASPPDPLGNDSVAYVSNVKAAGGFPIMTIGMLPWVAKDSTSYSFSVTKYGSQCQVNPFNSDDGNGVKADCATNITTNDPFDAHFAFRDDPAMGDPPGTVYRHPWVTLLAGAFGSGSCPVPNFFNTSCHFYNMDNEIDIWGGTHRDVHQSESGYNELRDTFLTEARAVKSWDPQAVRFGPVSCCWFFYWNLNSATDQKSTHAGIDFLPWWLNEVYWSDLVAGTRSLDAFDLHAYTEASGTGLSLAQQRALTLRVTRDWWDPSYTSEAWFGSNSVTTNQANDTKPFRIPRMRAVLNAIYPGTPLSLTEWNFVMVQPNGEADFSTALADVDAWGILGRERVSYSTRWTAADPSTPAYNSLKLYRNYDGAHHSFNSISVSASHDADPGLFSIYAATNPGGASLTLMAVNKDPVNAAQTTFTLSGFTPSQVTSYTLSSTSPSSIVAGSAQAWSSTRTFAPYSATLLVVTGSTPSLPASEWDLNPDTIMVPASGTATLHPKLLSAGTVTLGSPTSDAGVTMTTSQPAITVSQNGAVTVTAGSTPGFYHFSVPGTDGGGVTTTQDGWILVGKPAAVLAKTGGDAQTGTVGTILPQALKVTLSPGQSGGTAAGASVFFTASAGSLTNVQVGTEKVFAGSKVIALTNSSGVASVTLSLPATAGPVIVTAEGPYGLGHPAVTPFTEMAQ